MKRDLKRGMTLIELILVMGLLATVMMLALPRLGDFFSGRGLNEEARRLLEMTYFARSEAVSRSTPMQVWFEAASGNYGVSPATGFDFDGSKPVEYTLADNLSFNIDKQYLDSAGRASILFLPDGSLDENSLDKVRVEEDDTDSADLVKNDIGTEYMIQSADVEATTMEAEALRVEG